MTVKKGCLGCLGLITMIFIIAMLFGIYQDATKSANNSSQPNTATTETKVENWKYTEPEDKIHNTKTKMAICESVNTLDFKFPYSGKQHAALSIRQNYDGTKDVFVMIEKGQFMTSVLGGKALVRFDDNEPIEFALVAPQDNSTTTVFIKRTADFISSLLKSKKVYIQTTFFQEGNPTLEFNVEGFKTL